MGSLARLTPGQKLTPKKGSLDRGLSQKRVLPPHPSVHPSETITDYRDNEITRTVQPDEKIKQRRMKENSVSILGREGVVPKFRKHFPAPHEC